MMTKFLFTIGLAVSLLLSNLNAKEVCLEDKITSLYVSFFNRAADEDGLNYWKSQREAAEARGESALSILKQLSAGFATHPTFRAAYRCLHTKDFVRAIYRNSLGEAGDEAGVEYWANLLRHGKSRSDMVAEFMEASLTADLTRENYPALSQEELNVAQKRQDLMANKVKVAISFTDSLGRFSNIQDSQNPENDPAYLASVGVLKNITSEPTTTREIISKLNDLRNDNANAIAIINNNWKLKYSTLDYSTIISEATGRTWLDRNMGAKSICTSSTDEACYGDYYQWGREADGHEKLTSAKTLKEFPSLEADSEKFVISQFDWTEADDSGLQRGENWDICPIGYKVPTIDELLAETQGSSESVLNIPFSGQRTKSGYMKDRATEAYLQSSTPSSIGLTKMLRYNNIYASYNISTRTVAAPVRCIKIPTMTGLFLDGAVSRPDYSCSSGNNAVSRLDYSCSSGNSGDTNSLGEFTCQVDDMVSFSLGGTYLGGLQTKGFITPLALFDGDREAATNFAQLMQTLDINDELLERFGEIDFYSETFDEDIQALLGGDIILISEEEAQIHLDETFAAFSIDEWGNPLVVRPDPEPTDPEPTNHKPHITSADTISVNENQTDAIDINATDEDGDTLFYGISGTDADSFNINALTGVVTFKVAPDFETKTSYTFTATVTDGSRSDSQSIVITITDVADVVPTLADSTATIAEDLAEGGSVGTLTINSAGDRAITQITLSGVDAPNFSVATDGNITLANGANLDFETKTLYNLEAVARNAAGYSVPVSLDITITNVVEVAPTLADSTATIAEDLADGGSVGTLTISSEGDGAITLITLSGDGAPNFSVATDGNITLANGANLDFETKALYNLTAVATNAAGNSASVTLDITITDVADTTELYIKSAVYDNNRTVPTKDDKLYIYFNKSIYEDSIAVDTSANYVLNGTGAIGSASGSDYNDTVFHRHTISQDDGSTGSLAISTSGDTNISMAVNTIRDTNNLYPQDYNETIVEKFIYIKKTGQTDSYDYGDDGFYQIGVTPSYTRNDATGIVTDNITSLMWQDDETTNGMNWSTGVDYCSGSELGGFYDWRLPTSKELEGIVDYSAVDPSIDEIFGNIEPESESTNYWSSTHQSGSNESRAWIVDFYDGAVRNVDSLDFYTYQVRCVRGGDGQ
ncbi:MAG: DUF1566 domain-containing protein [Sulfurimonas sp.]|nr:DUF1566 domain-containing protein [Sulfurimonas sp.]